MIDLEDQAPQVVQDVDRLSEASIEQITKSKPKPDLNVHKVDNDLSMSDDDLGGDQGKNGGAGNRNIFLQMSLPSLSIHSAQDINDDIEDN